MHTRHFTLPCCLSAALLALTCASGWAGSIKLWTPEELYAKAATVVIATVTDVTPTERKTELRLGGETRVEARVHAASLEIDQVLKGETDSSALLEFARVDDGIADALAVEPRRVYLKKGHSYTFYLSPSKDGAAFVPVLEPDFDSAQSVKPIGSTSGYPNISDEELADMPRLRAEVAVKLPCAVQLRTRDGRKILIGSPFANEETNDFLATLERGKSYQFPDVFLEFRKGRAEQP